MQSVEQLKYSESPPSESSDHVALIQWRLLPHETSNAEGFARAVEERTAQVCSNRQVKLLVFPELSGLWLQLSSLLGRPAVIESYAISGSSVSGGFPGGGGFGGGARLAAGLLATKPGAVLRFLTGRGGRALTGRKWAQYLRQWLDPFCRAAEKHSVYICPGSSFLPVFRYTPRGIPEITDRRTANTSCLIGPNGKVLGFRKKLRLTTLEKRLGLVAGDAAEDLLPYRTELGRIGLAVCLDGFYEDIVARLDMQGTEYVLQPSANSIDWNALLVREAGRQVRQSEEWLSCGIGSLIQGRESLLAAYNPMCVTQGRLFSHSGRSTAWVNCRRVASQSGEEGGNASEATPARRTSAESGSYQGLIRIAENKYQEEILYVGLPR